MSIHTLRAGRRRAFTLVELLVVIGIIALLISILIPALQKVKEQANAVKCMTQQKQLLTAWMMYAADNKGLVFLPPSVGEYYAPGSGLGYFMSEDAKATSGCGILRYDVGPFWAYLSKTTAGGTANAALAASTGKLYTLMNCPSEIDSYRPVIFGGAVIGPASAKRNYSFSWNQWLRTSRHPSDTKDVAKKISQIKNPSEKIVLVEENTPNDGMAWSFPYDGDDTPTFRHNGKGEFGFGDGHVAPMLPTDIGFLKAKNIGSSAPQDTSAAGRFKLKKFFYLTEKHPEWNP